MSDDELMFLGTSGEMLVKAKLLERGWNVSTPMIDDGDDLFAIRGEARELGRVQVKTGETEERPYGYSAQFRIGSDRLKQLAHPPLTYVFVARHAGAWGPMLVIPQMDLQKLVVNEEMGSGTDEGRVFYVRYHRSEGEVERVECSDSELSAYLGGFAHWEPPDGD